MDRGMLNKIINWFPLKESGTVGRFQLKGSDSNLRGRQPLFKVSDPSPFPAPVRSRTAGRIGRATIKVRQVRAGPCKQVRSPCLVPPCLVLVPVPDPLRRFG